MSEVHMRRKTTASVVLSPSHAATTKPTSRRWLALTSLAAASFVDRGEDQTLGILWPQIQQSLGASVGDLGSLLGISKLVNTILLPVWGYASDRFSRRLLLIWFTGLWGVWTVAIGLVESLPQLMLVRLLSSLGLGVFTPAAFSLLGDLYPSSRRGRAAGVIHGMGFIGSIIAFGVLPALAAQGAEAWRWGFVLMGIASCCTGILIFLGVQEPLRGSAESQPHDPVQLLPVERTPDRWANLRALAAIPSWRLLLATEALRSLGTSLIGGWVFTWATGLGLGPLTFVVAMLSALGIICGNFLFGAMGDWIDERFPRYGRLMLMLLGMVVTMPTTMVFLASDGHNLAQLLIFAVVSGCAQAAGVVLWPVGQAIVPPEVRGSSRAVIEMLAGITGAVSLALSSVVANRLGVATMLLLLTPLPAVLTILVWLPMFRTYPRDHAALQQRLAQRQAALEETQNVV